MVRFVEGEGGGDDWGMLNEVAKTYGTWHQCRLLSLNANFLLSSRLVYATRQKKIGKLEGNIRDIKYASSLPLSENLNHHQKKKKKFSSQQKHLLIPPSSWGLKLSSSKPGIWSFITDM
jgi:hypothetical protein